MISNRAELPFADHGIGTVITDNVPIGGATWLEPGVQPSDIWRILTPDGTWMNNGVPVVPPGP